MHRGKIAAPFSAANFLVRQSIYQVERSIYCREGPQFVTRSGKFTCGIKRRNVGDFSDTWRERSGKEVPRGREEAARAVIVGCQGPWVVGIVAGDRKRYGGAGDCTAECSGQVNVEQVV